MQITRGKIPCAKKTVLYGPEGIGKSTFAAHFPNAVFIDTEGSTKDMDVARLPSPSSWAMLLEEVKYAISNPTVCQTLIVDTADWAEQLCVNHILDKFQKAGIEEFGYGKGYTYLQEEFGRFLNLLTELVEQKGVNVVLTAHAKMRKFEQPDEMGAYDRWELKLSKQVFPIVKEWADMVLFANYKINVINVDGQGAQKGKNKAQGGRRVLYTTHHSCWDAKNRYGLADEVPFEYEAIAHIIPVNNPILGSTGSTRQSAGNTAVPSHQSNSETGSQDDTKSKAQSEKETKTAPPVGDKSIAEGQQISPDLKQGQDTTIPFPALDPLIPRELSDLMTTNRVDEWDIQNVVAARGYFPSDMPIKDYPADFVSGVLVGAWDQVYAMIKEMRAKEEVPFN